MHLQILRPSPGWGDRHWLSEPTTGFRIMGKEICFHRIGPIMILKRICYTISTIFFICVYRRQKSIFKTRHADKYWIRPKMLALR